MHSFCVILIYLIVVLLLSGGVIFRANSGKVIFELSDISAFVLLLGIVLVYRIWRGDKDFSQIYLIGPVKQVKRFKVWLESTKCDDERLKKLCLGIGIGFSIFVFVTLVLGHLALRSGFDTAIFDQVLFNSTHGKFHYSSIKGDLSLFADHFQPILFLGVPLYYVFSSPIWLFLLQAASVFIAVWALIGMCAKLELSKLHTLVFVVLLVSFVGYRGLLYWDFHPMVLSVPILFWCFNFILSGSIFGVTVCIFLALMCKEHMGLYTSVIGVYIFFRMPHRLHRLIGVLVITASLGSYYWVMHSFMPSYGKQYEYLSRYAELGSGYYDIAMNLLNPVRLIEIIAEPAKIKYLLFIFGQVAFLPFFAPFELFLLAPILAQNLLSSFPSMYSLGSHYTALVIVFVFFAALTGLSRVNRYRFQTKLLKIYQSRVTLILIFCCLLFYGRSDVLKFRQALFDSSQVFPLWEAAERLPEGTRLSAQHMLLPHFTSRNSPTYLYPTEKKVDYVLVSLKGKPWPLSKPEFNKMYESMFHEHQLVWSDDNISLFKVK